MKQSFAGIPAIAIISILLTISVNKVTLSQPPPPPKASSGSLLSNSSNEADAAPVGEGIWVLLALAASYGLNRSTRKRELSPENQLLQVSDEDIIKHIGNSDQNQLIQNSGFVDENQI
jgi:hypothetical protein